MPEAAECLDVAGECGDEGPLIAAVDPFRYEGRDRLLGRPRALRGAGERGEGEPAGPGKLTGGNARGGVVERDQARGRTARGRSGIVGAPWDSVVRHRRMGHFHEILRRHVAADARTGGRLGVAFDRRQRARLLLVAGLALRSVEGIDLFRGRFGVGIVAGDAAEGAPGPLPAAALPHLLDLANRLRTGGCRGPLVVDEHEECVVEEIAGAEVVEPAAKAGDRRLATEMALVADRFAAPRFEVDRIDDSQVGGGHPGGKSGHRRHVLPAGPMAALAADRRLRENPRRIPPAAVGGVLHEPRMTMEATVPDRPLEAQPPVVLIARGEPIPTGAAVPADRRLGEQPVVVEKIGAAARPGADREPHRQGLVVDRPAVGVEDALVVENDAVALLDHVLPLPIGERSHLAALLDRPLPGHGVHRLAHRVLGEALGDRGVTAAAGLRADIPGGARRGGLEGRYRCAGGRRGAGNDRGPGRLRTGLRARSLDPRGGRSVVPPLPPADRCRSPPQRQPGDPDDHGSGDEESGVAGPGHGGDEAPMRGGDETWIQDSGDRVPVAMPATGPACTGHPSDVGARHGSLDSRFPGPLIRCLPVRPVSPPAEASPPRRQPGARPHGGAAGAPTRAPVADVGHLPLDRRHVLLHGLLFQLFAAEHPRRAPASVLAAVRATAAIPAFSPRPWPAAAAGDTNRLALHVKFDLRLLLRAGLADADRRKTTRRAAVHAGRSCVRFRRLLGRLLLVALRLPGSLLVARIDRVGGGLLLVVGPAGEADGGEEQDGDDRPVHVGISAPRTWRQKS